MTHPPTVLAHLNIKYALEASSMNAIQICRLHLLQSNFQFGFHHSQPSLLSANIHTYKHCENWKSRRHWQNLNSHCPLFNHNNFSHGLIFWSSKLKKTSPQAKRYKPSLLIISLTILTSLAFITRLFLSFITTKHFKTNISSLENF